jgi:hypothetical protein
MIKRKYFIALSLTLAFSFLLTSCNLPGAGAAPTADPLAQQATIDAAIFQTLQAVSAEQTSVAAALPTSTFTVAPTQEPAATATPEPTATPVLPTATQTAVPVIPTKTYTPTPAPYTCSLVSTSPTSGTKIKINTDFDAIWKVKNVGTKAWEVGYLDLKYVSGTKMQTAADVFDISTYVGIGGELTLVVDMKAPASTGKYSASWALMMEGITLCTLPVNIEAIP